LAAKGFSVFVADSGLDATTRDHSNPKHLGMGVGGCGLFSDGKFSFRPSATKLWALEGVADLGVAEAWTLDRLRAVGLGSLDIPATRTSDVRLDGATRKRYPSLYLSLPARRQLVDGLVRECGGGVNTQTTVLRLGLSASGTLRCLLRSSDRGEVQIDARAAILATGRMGPIAWSNVFPEGRMVFRRVELGVRIDHPSGVGPLAAYADPDVKIVYGGTDPDAEWRTFCSCRGGQVVGISYSSLAAYSGRADAGPGDRFNFGLNLRLADPGTAASAWAALLRAQGGLVAGELPPPVRLVDVLASPESQAQPEMVAAVAAHFGGGWQPLVDGVRRITDGFPELVEADTLVYGPAIEGVGYYPDVDNTLRAAPHPIWVAGDASGLFRGNTAALVSGYYAGLRAGAFLSGS
jgi:hypothetical protein